MIHLADKERGAEIWHESSTLNNRDRRLPAETDFHQAAGKIGRIVKEASPCLTMTNQVTARRG